MRRISLGILSVLLTVAGGVCQAQNSGEAEKVLTEPARGSEFASIADPGKSTWGELSPGAIVYADSDQYRWESVPADFHGIKIQKHPKHAGVLNFSVVSDGFAFIVTSDRWDNSGNSGGDWLDEVMYEKDLRRAGWRKLSGIKNLSTSDSGEMLVFWRYCKAGEAHSIRTEKYIAPMLLTR